MILCSPVPGTDNDTGAQAVGAGTSIKRKAPLVRTTLTATLALLTITGCENPNRAPATQQFPLAQEAAALLESTPDGPWSGVWSTEGTSLDSDLRATHLGDGVYVVEEMGTVNAVMHGVAGQDRLRAHEGGQGNRLEIALPPPGNTCTQGWRVPPSAEPVPMMVCRAR